MDGGYENTQQAPAESYEHPCAKYWEQFQHCMQFNPSDISSCQQFYNTFNKCNANPSSFIQNLKRKNKQNSISRDIEHQTRLIQINFTIYD